MALALPARADVSLPAIISDHMVLQCGATVPIWGRAAPGEEITVTIANQTQTTRATPAGDWIVRFPNLQPPAAPAAPVATASTPARQRPIQNPESKIQNPLTLTIRAQNTTTAPTTLLIHDVLLGEVWLGSGQSNMVLSITRGAADPAATIAAANHPQIRLFTEESFGAATPQRTGKGKWVVCTPETIPEFSAVLYFFGLEIQRALNVPVGLVHSARGGTRIESWIDYDAQKKIPGDYAFLKSMADDYAAAAKTSAKPTDKPGKSAGKQMQTTMKAIREGPPGGLFNAKIAPLIPFAIRGLLWYQGEANTQPECAPYYGRQLQLLVSDWRARWGSDFPVAWVQLPRYSVPDRDWPRVREGQLNALVVPKTGMAVAIDTGDKDNIHPRNKLEAGHRLALWALGEVYGQPVPSTSGPLPAAHEIRDNKIVIHFTHADGGLVAKPAGTALTGFLIAGADKQWRPARARIEGDTVILTSPDVPNPVAARYAWENYPTCNLTNAAGLPASPFRTDDL